MRRAPLIAHIIYRFDVGGMENGLVNLINAVPSERYRHAIVCLTEYTDFRRRIRQPGVECFALHKRPGKDMGVYWRLWRLLRTLRPDIVHTRNLPALDSLAIAALAKVPARVHGEHGRDVIDLEGNNLKYNTLRRVLRPLAQRYIAVSCDLAAWLRDRIGVSAARLTQIYNGVDAEKFSPAVGGRAALPVEGFAPPGSVVIGSVGRLQTVKDQATLVKAFIALIEMEPKLRSQLRLVLVGDGPLRTEIQRLIESAGIEELVWLPGSRDDIPQILQALDIFVLPSLAEGISNTLLEAMACGLPVVATRVGGSPELVEDGVTGVLVPSADPVAMATALLAYVRDPQLIRRHGCAGRERIVREFSMHAMVHSYLAVYDSFMAGHRPNRDKRA
jgi:sugar transferase (PEP-CTERM/EpsH1 system associated)